MGLSENLAATAALVPEEFGRFRQHIPEVWVEAALAATGTASIRHRRIPAEQVVWAVIGMAMFRNHSITDVVRTLELPLPDAKSNKAIVNSAIPQARKRLGAEPLRWLFMQTGCSWADSSAERDLFHGLTKWGVDGTTLNVPDTESNREYFGSSNNQRGTSSYPRARVVTLMALSAHVLRDARIGSYRQSELALAKPLWPQIPDDSVTLLDRLFFGAPVLWNLANEGSNRHWVTRGRTKLKMRIIERLGPGDHIVEMDVSDKARRKDPRLPATWRFRRIRYRHKGSKQQTLLTSLVDAEKFPAHELIALYHERWELELGIGEIKTSVLERREALRSQSPEAVMQEIWGVLLAYNLVRVEMGRIAALAGVPPTRISFVTMLRELRVSFHMWSYTSPGALPRRIRDFEEGLVRFILPKRRRERRYPRAVKIKMSPYARNRPRSPTKRRLN